MVWCGRVGWPRKSGWIAGTPLGLPLAATLRAEDALFYLLLDQALFGGGGGGVPNRNYAGA